MKGSEARATVTRFQEEINIPLDPWTAWTWSPISPKLTRGSIRAKAVRPLHGMRQNASTFAPRAKIVAAFKAFVAEIFILYICKKWTGRSKNSKWCLQEDVAIYQRLFEDLRWNRCLRKRKSCCWQDDAVDSFIKWLRVKRENNWQ